VVVVAPFAGMVSGPDPTSARRCYTVSMWPEKIAAVVFAVLVLGALWLGQPHCVEITTVVHEPQSWDFPAVHRVDRDFCVKYEWKRSFGLFAQSSPL